MNDSNYKNVKWKYVNYESGQMIIFNAHVFINIIFVYGLRNFNAFIKWSNKC